MGILTGLIRLYRTNETQIRHWDYVPGPRTFFSIFILCFSLCGPALRAQPTGLSCCADTVIRFDDLPANVSVTAHYRPQGVDFGLPPYSSLPPASQIPLGIRCCFPRVRVAPSGHSSQVADISTSGGEFFQPGMFGTFTTFRRRVQVTVGNFMPGETANITLSGYNVMGALVAQSATRVVAGGNPPVTLIAIAAGADPSVAYFVVQAAELNKAIWVDDLTFDNPRAPSPADFALGTPNGSGGSAFWLARGSSATKDFPVTRFNGSNGNITFFTDSLPAGLTASFAPNPIQGATTSTTLTLSAASDTPLVRDGGLTVTAVPADPAVGQQARQVKVIVNVIPQFTVYVSPDSVDLPPCTPVQVSPIYVNKNPGFTDEVVLTLRVSASDGSTSDLPAGLQANFSPSAVLPQGAGFGVFGVTLTSDGSVSGDLAVVVQGTSGLQQGGIVGGTAVTLSGSLVQTAPFTIHTIPAGIDDVTPSRGRTPQSLQAGTQVLIKGRGFCPGLKVRFGNIFAEVGPDSMNTTEIRAKVPRSATTGKITLAGGSGSAIDSPSDFTVDTYRNTAGFSFINYKPHITFAQMTATFGRDQTYDSIDFCFPFGCTVDIRDPAAMVLNAIANDAFSGERGGACFGFGLGSQRILTGRRSLSDFSPPGAQTIWALDAPDSLGGPSGPLTEYINSQQIAQLGMEFISQYLAHSLIQSHLSSSDRFNLAHESVRAALAGGDHPVILVKNDSVGHAVVAYDIEDAAPNQFFIYVYDPNNPYLSRMIDDVDGVQFSRIEVTNDTWQLLDFVDGANFLSGSIADLIVMSARDIPMQPAMPGGGPVSTLILFSSAGPAGSATRTIQLADGAGHSLFGPGGKLNSDPATRLQATPFAPFMGPAAAVETFLVALNLGVILQTVEGTAAIPSHHTLMASDFVARVDTEAIVGVSDQISFDPTGGVGFKTEAARKALTASIVTRTKAGVQSAELTTTSLRDGADEFRFDQTRSDVILHHVGTSVSVRLRLASLQKNASPMAFESGLLQIGPGETATFSPANWSHLDAVSMTLRGPEGQERRTILQNSLKTSLLGRIVGLDVDDKTAKTLQARSLEITSRLGSIPPGSQVAVAWTVREAGRTVAHEQRMLREPELLPGLRRDRFMFYAPGPGHYTVRADLIIVTMEGVIPVPRASTRSASLVIR
jgi:hypothetical protein